MADITKERITLVINWNKADPGNLTWNATASCITPDDKEDAGQERFTITTPQQTITRATFRGLTGTQIQTQVIAAVDAAIQTLGSGAGSHVLTNDVGDLS